MTKKEFIKEFQDVAKVLFLDRGDKNPSDKALAWFGVCLKSVESGVFDRNEVIRGLKRLLVSDKKFLNIGDLLSEIRKERVLEIS